MLKYIASLLMTSLLMSQAHAEETTAGEMIKHIGTDLYGPLFATAILCSFLMGIILIGKGVSKLKDISSHQGGPNLSKEALLMIFGGTCLIALPDVMGAGLYTFYQTGSFEPQSVAVGGVASCMNSTTGDASVTCVAHNIATNVVPVFSMVFFALSFITGLYIILSQIRKLAVSHEHGRHELEKGWLLKLCVGVIVCNLPFLIKAVETTVGIESGEVVTAGGLDSGSSMLSYSGGSSSVSQAYSQLIGYIFTILVIFGLIAIWRGLMLLKTFAEGRPEKTMGAAITHIIGGVFLTNAQFSTCLIITTAWGSGNGFC